jgi:Na+-translocating ferredoxin:NAD+ oxidoreductase RnfG subunit
MRCVTIRRIAIAVTLAVIAAQPVRAQEVLLSADQARREIFPEGVRTRNETRALDVATRARLEKQLGRPIDEDSVAATLVYDSAGVLRGYAVITEEIGKYRPITFMVGVTPQFTVRDVAVMVYRESRGGDVKRKRFLAQYRGKSTRDPIDLNRDIINISGATISVRSMNAGVKRVLAEIQALYGR